MQATNTNGIIAAAAEKQNAPAANNTQTPTQVLNELLNNSAIQEQLKSTLKENAGAFVTSVLNVFREDSNLQICDPKMVLGEALKAAALKLPIEKQLGFGYIISFKDHGVPKPQFQLGYKGYIQLAIRTGVYKHISARAVYEGELKSINKLTGIPDISGNKVSNEIIGYFAYYETLGGFEAALYWTKDEVKAHAQRYSKSYQKGSMIWKNNFDEMATKTVLRNLLSHYGVMSVEINTAMVSEENQGGAFPEAAPEAANPREIETEGAIPEAYNPADYRESPYEV